MRVRPIEHCSRCEQPSFRFLMGSPAARNSACNSFARMARRERSGERSGRRARFPGFWNRQRSYVWRLFSGSANALESQAGMGAGLWVWWTIPALFVLIVLLMGEVRQGGEPDEDAAKQVGNEWRERKVCRLSATHSGIVPGKEAAEPVTERRKTCASGASFASSRSG